MTHQELRDAVSRHIEEYRDAYNETGDERYRAVKNELLHVLGLIDAVDGKPGKFVGKDKMTLEELAQELSKIFKFRYLTVTDDFPLPTIMMWGEEVEYDGRGWNIVKPKSYYGSFNVSALCIVLDLSEYKGEDSEIDFSKCIVEVEE